MRTIFYILALTGIILATGVTAQVKYTTVISGSVTDEHNKPADFVTISLLHAGDSSLVKTTLTDQAGRYRLENIAPADYIISASMVGYSKVYSRPVHIVPGSGDIIAPEAIKLSPQSKTLKEVAVTAQRPLVERHTDKVVMNVEGSSIATGSTALEVLQKAPGVTVDQNDRIAMQGKQGVLIMIDGKPTYMSNADVATMLKNMQSSQIESIELISNPSARYDASGNSGIINIKTRKSKSAGTNGSVTAGTGYSRHHRGNAALNLNHRNKSINAFGNYNFSANKNIQHLAIDRVNTSAAETLYFGQSGDDLRSNRNNSFKAGLDWFINPHNTLGVLLNGYANRSRSLFSNKTLIGPIAAQADSAVMAQNHGNNRYRNLAYNINYKSVLDTSGQELSVDLDYSSYRGNERTLYNNDFLNAQSAPLRAPSVFRNATPSAIQVKAVKTDYTLPLSKTTRFEAGLKSSWVKTDNDFRFENQVADYWINDTRRSNRFIYSENINAAYVNLNRQFKKTSLQLGLRAEQTNSKGNSVTENKIVNRHYLNLFPSVFVTRALNKHNDLGLSYSRRIDRPSYDALNPFSYFIDQYAYNKGNPFLNPQYTNNFELSYTYNKTYSLTLGYGHTNDVIMEVVLPDTSRKALFQTNENLARQLSYSANFNIPITIAKGYSTSNNLNIFYLAFRSPNLLGRELNTGRPAFQFKTTHSLTLSKTCTAELAADYQSPMEYGTLKIGAQYGADLGLNKSLLNRKANIKLALSDIFDTRRAKIASAYTGLSYSLTQKGETRIGRLTFTYRFGRNEVKPARGRTTGLEDEQNRMKN